MVNSHAFIQTQPTWRVTMVFHKLQRQDKISNETLNKMTQEDVQSL